MKNEMKDYRDSLKKKIDENAADTDWEAVRDELALRIGYYQHERLIHLIVTMTFAIMTVLSFILIYYNPLCILLSVLLLALTVPYIWHYYFLENTVQLLYTYMYKLRERCGK